ncbi:MAG: hypothetical protein HXY34_10625 [Candidatus Thorarchaeota archaeon]|nr:hypothetical protein [Candidatus Thorarchaeota archaeon]
MSHDIVFLRRRAAALTVAAALLDVGLFNVLFVLAPVASGLIAGLLLGEKRYAVAASFLGGLIAYLPLFLWVNIAAGSTIYLPTMAAASLIMAVISGIFGLVGTVLRGTGRADSC